MAPLLSIFSSRLRQQVADANYAGMGPVKVDTIPLLDNVLIPVQNGQQ